jgi:hypothetical protein
MTDLQRALTRRRAQADRAAKQVRRRLAAAGAVDAVDALDGLSVSERYLLGTNELDWR